jgi:hypothetical protein
VGPDKVYSQVDSVTDKTIREGPETRFQNEMRPRDFKVAIAPGSYQCRFFIGNVVPEGYEESFVGGPLDKRLIVDDVEVLPSGTTQVRIGVKRKMKVGSPQLVVFE